MTKTFDQLKKSIPLFGFIGTMGGFVADVLQPIAPFSSYIFFATAFSSVTVGIAVLMKASLRTNGIPALIFSISMMICSGLLYASQDESKEKSGVLASVIPGLSKLQSSLGILHEDLETIKKSTKKIEETTTQTAEMVKRVEENTEKTVRETQKVSEAVQDSTKQIVGSLEEIQKGFSQLTQAGGVIANPNRPEQFYHNARIQEQGGDYGNARRSYNKYFTFKLEFLDPHFRYQRFLKVQEGRAGAREIYSIMYENDKRPVIELARILLYDPPKRTEMLKNFVKRFSDYSPAYYELSREFSEIRKGTQSLADKKEEMNALQSFNDLRKDGKFLKYFVDKELASKWIDDVESRLKKSSVLEVLSKNPVSISIDWNKDPIKGTIFAWYVNIKIADLAKEIFYKTNVQQEIITTGHLNNIDLETGLKTPIPQISLKSSLDIPINMLEISYSDINNVVHGPFVFDKDKLRLQFLIFFKGNIFKNIQKNIFFLKYGGDRTVLNLNLCAIKEIEYKINNSINKKITSICEKEKGKYAIFCYTKKCRESTKFPTKTGDKIIAKVTFFDDTESKELKHTVPLK